MRRHAIFKPDIFQVQVQSFPGFPYIGPGLYFIFHTAVASVGITCYKIKILWFPDLHKAMVGIHFFIRPEAPADTIFFTILSQRIDKAVAIFSEFTQPYRNIEFFTEINGKYNFFSFFSIKTQKKRHIHKKSKKIRENL